MNRYETQKAMIIVLALVGYVTWAGLGYGASVATATKPKPETTASITTAVKPIPTYWRQKLRSLLPWAGGAAATASLAALALVSRQNQAVDTISISIKCSHIPRRRLSFKMYSDATVSQLKRHIELIEGTEVERQQLVSDGEVLHDFMSLRQYSKRLNLESIKLYRVY